MNIDVERITPRLIERRCGGWIATSEANASLKIGVTADTEQQARLNFERAVKEWEHILTTPRKDG